MNEEDFKEVALDMQEVMDKFKSKKLDDNFIKLCAVLGNELLNYAQACEIAKEEAYGLERVS